MTENIFLPKDGLCNISSILLNVKKTADLQTCAVCTISESYFGLMGFQDSNDGSGDGTCCSIHLREEERKMEVGHCPELQSIHRNEWRSASSAFLLCGRTAGCRPLSHTGC